MTTARSTSSPVSASAIGRDDTLLAEYFEHWTAVQPNAAAVTFIDYSATRAGQEIAVSYRELDVWTRALAVKLMELTEPGDRVALLTPQGPSYCAAFVAAMRTSAINVPLYPPDLPGHDDRLRAVMADCAPTVVLTTSDKLDMVRAFCAEHGGPADDRILCVDEYREGHDDLADSYERPAGLDIDDVAYLQYTSGSTRIPAGVVLTHRNLTKNIMQLRGGYAMDFQQLTCVSWLPLFHDMGLLLGIGAPFIGGGHSILLDPIAFLLKPRRWLEAVSGKPNAVTCAPNFAYDFVAKRVREADREGLDFSQTRSWGNGAEPVLTSTLDAFCDAFAPQGVRRDAVRPTYGLAEATVCVTVTPVGEDYTVLDVDAMALQQGVITTEIADGGRSTPLVASGKPVDQLVCIADPDTREQLGEGVVGEIWVNGDNVGQGYWEKPAETEALFDATLVNPGALPETGWLRTEDLGVLVDGRLFVTGRIKDLIIIDGRNIYPQDIEFTVESSHAAIAQRRLASFSVPTGSGEALVVVAERYRQSDAGPEQLEEIVRAASKAVSEQHSVALHDFILVEPDSIHRTSSGKIARKATRTAYLDGALSRIGPS